MPLNEEGFISRVSVRHSISADAVRTILRALRSGGGAMAQFSHPDFGGMSQWAPGMTMSGVGGLCRAVSFISRGHWPRGHDCQLSVSQAEFRLVASRTRNTQRSWRS